MNKELEKKKELGKKLDSFLAKYKETSESHKQKLITEDNYDAARLSAYIGATEDYIFIYNECNQDKKQELISALDYQAAIFAAQFGYKDIYDFIYDKCDPDKKQDLIAAEKYQAARLAADIKHIYMYKFIYEKCDSDKKQDLLAAEKYQAAIFAAENGQIELYKFIYNECHQDKKQDLLSTENNASIIGSAKYGHIIVLAFVAKEVKKYTDPDFKKIWSDITLSTNFKKLNLKENIKVYMEKPERLIKLSQMHENLIESGWSYDEIEQIPKFIKQYLRNILHNNLLSPFVNLPRDVLGEILSNIPINIKGKENRLSITPSHMTDVFDVIRCNKKRHSINQEAKANIEHELNFWKRLVTKTNQYEKAR